VLYPNSQCYVDYRLNLFDIDSAHVFLRKGTRVSEALETKDISKLAKAGMDSLAIVRLGDRIDSIAFDRAKMADTENDYLFFLKNYPSTVYEEEAMSLRNARAFDDALQRNTYQAYRDFMDKYPKAYQFEEAERRYERLYFEKSTSDGKLNSFKKFLRTHPSTPYREELEWRIFKVMTADHNTSSYEVFCKEYPTSKYTRIAEQFGYHVAKEKGLQFYPRYFKDSLGRLEDFNGQLLF